MLEFEKRLIWYGNYFYLWYTY